MATTVILTKTDVGSNLFRNAAKGVALPTIKYFAVGTGNSPPSSAQIKLDAEAYRKGITSFTDGVIAGQLIVNVYLAPTDAVGVSIAEVAVFAGPAATNTGNSGVMLGRGQYSHPNKSNIESIVLQLILQF